MDVFPKAWISAMEKRRAVRSFDTRALSEGDLSHLKKIAKEQAPTKGARAVVLEQGAADVFSGMQGAYGSFQGCRSLAVFVVDTRVRNAWEQLGFLGEALILEAVSGGMATCWVGGTYRPEVAGRWADMAGGEKIAAVAALGYAAPGAAPAGGHVRKPLSELVKGLAEKEWPAWMRQALEAARLAPSHLNRQPVRYEAGKDSILVKFEGQEMEAGVSKRLECGIAMLHIETAARSAGAKGKWEYLDSAGEVARFAL